MRKLLFWSLPLLLFASICFISCSDSDIIYPAGKDTTYLFGDGTFQISQSEHESLFSEKYGSCIIERVEAVQENESKVYVVGVDNQGYASDNITGERHYNIYVVIDLNNNTMQLCAIPEMSYDREFYIYKLDKMIENGDAILLPSISDFSEKDQLVFQDMT